MNTATFPALPNRNKNRDERSEEHMTTSVGYDYSHNSATSSVQQSTSPITSMKTAIRYYESTQPALFQSGLTSRRDSMLCYQATFSPLVELKAAHSIAWSRQVAMTKRDLIAHCNHDQTHITLEGRGDLRFPLNWKNNCVPTKIEWDKMSDNSTFLIDCKIGRLVDGGRVATICPVSLYFFPSNSAE